VLLNYTALTSAVYGVKTSIANDSF